ncbi:TetR family transcriptional regulator [Streptomyces hainanensis]|uniref:TetR family transcriptional regulator n=1 Tax=Streptomyces hainanensis TaxID=402648 RepID=A0A4V2Y205_9ACTN|nr:TetR family transcriptional regulator [Streptomyces hainanensis]TDC70755.1 TetR family transcriptional regulator [Streptomyces hainanensis]
MSSSRSAGRGPGRPHAASRREVERTVIALLRRDGYDGVSVEQMVEAAGIGRTTFFRYFGSKAGVIWYAFDDTIEGLESRLRAAAPDADPLDAVRHAVVASNRAAVLSSDVWLERFRLLDSSPALRAGAYEHWERWKLAIARYLADRAGTTPQDPLVLATASACQGVFVADLRTWLSVGDTGEAFSERLDRNLATLTAALRALFPA